MGPCFQSNNPCRLFWILAYAYTVFNNVILETLGISIKVTAKIYNDKEKKEKDVRKTQSKENLLSCYIPKIDFHVTYPKNNKFY